jgi:hypothetical protein
MQSRAASFCTINALILGLAMLADPFAATAQRHGGGDSSGGAGLSTYSRPDGVDEKDALKDYHHILAVQATPVQVAEFQAVVKSTQNAKAALQAFLQGLGPGTANGRALHRDAALNQTLENARKENKNFVDGFSDEQKSGLKETTKRLDKADSDFEQEQQKLDQILQAANPAVAEVSVRAGNLEKALTDFSAEQVALGREMSIVLASGQDLTFHLPTVKTPVSIDGRTVAIPVSGLLEQIEQQNGQRTFRLELNEDLSDLQQSIEALLHAELERPNPCGERLAVRQAMLTPSAPASLVVLRLHYERWSCSRMYGQTSANELAESDGLIEVKLTPSFEKSNTLQLTAEFGRIDASGMFADSLRSGDLGDDLRDKVARCVLSALRSALNFKTTLPPALENTAAIQSAQFRDAGAGVLHVVFEGKTQISDEQANVLASQLNQTMAAPVSSSQ